MGHASDLRLSYIPDLPSVIVFQNKYVESMVHAFQKVGKGISYTSINFKINLK